MKPGLTALVCAGGLLLSSPGAMAAAKDMVPTVKTPVSADKAPAPTVNTPVATDKAPVAAEQGGFAEKGAASAEKGRSRPFNKQNIYMYFRQVAEAKH